MMEEEVPGSTILRQSLPGSLNAAAAALLEDARQQCASSS